MNIFKMLSEKKRKDLEARKKAHREKLEKLTAEYNEEVVEMLSAFCPIVGGDCRKTCIHFNKGGVFEVMDWQTNEVCLGRVGYNSPKCKLWRC